MLNNKDESISIMSKALERQEEQIKELHEKNQYLYLEMIHYKNLAGIRAKMKFARQKEALSEQLSLFDDIEANQEEGELEERIAEAERKPEEKKEIQRRRNLVNFENSDLPIKRFDVRLNDDKLIDINSDISKRPYASCRPDTTSRKPIITNTETKIPARSSRPLRKGEHWASRWYRKKSCPKSSMTKS